MRAGGGKSARKSKKNRNTVLTVLLDVSIGREEADRIGGCFDDEPIYNNIIYTYCPKASSLFKQYERNLPVKGFRPGTNAHRKKACERLIRFLKDLEQKYFSANWGLYRFGVIRYYREERSDIYALLDEEIASNDPIEAIESLMKSAVIRSIELSEVEQFIDLFGLKCHEKITSAVEKVTNNDPSIITDIVRDISKKIDSLEERIGLESEPSNDSNEKISSIEANLKSLEKKLQKFDQEKGQVQEPKSHESYRLDEFNGYIRETVNAVHEDIDTTIEVLEAKWDNNLQSKNEVYASQLEKIDVRLNAIQIWVKSGNKRLDAIEEQYDALTDVLKDNQDSLLPSSVIKKNFRKLKPPKKFNIVTDENHFAAHYCMLLERVYNIFIDRTQALIYHTLFLEMPLILVEDYFLFEAWVKALGWEKNVLPLVATPTWLSERDWSDGVQSILDENDNPQFIVIHNFDVALVQCYLMPLLHKRSLRDAEISSMTKLVLVSSETDVLTEYPDILQYGVGIPADDFRVDEDERRLSTYIDELRFAFDHVGSTFVRLETLLEWRCDSDSLQSLSEIWRATELHIPRIQKRLAAHLNVALADRLSKEESMLASIYHTVRLWCEAQHGEDIAKDLFDLAMIEAGDKVSY
ncbi:hypothetical protein ACFL2V_10140 [Pseudomonadota bacterium]